DEAAAAATEVLVDDDDPGESPLPGAVGPGVLTLPTLLMRTQLRLSGLPDVDIGLEGQVGGSQFIIHLCISPNLGRLVRDDRRWRPGSGGRRPPASDGGPAGTPAVAVGSSCPTAQLDRSSLGIAGAVAGGPPSCQGIGPCRSPEGLEGSGI